MRARVRAESENEKREARGDTALFLRSRSYLLSANYLFNAIQMVEGVIYIKVA
jgi:hypothetical protein